MDSHYNIMNIRKISNDMFRILVLKLQLFVSVRDPNRKTLSIDKHGNGVDCHCLKWSILMKLCYNILCIFRNNFHYLKKAICFLTE